MVDANKMKKALIIGAAGFVGKYLIEELLLDGNIEIVATKLSFEKLEIKQIQIYDLDILDEKSIALLLKNVQPDYIYHLAAQSSVNMSWKEPGLTVDVNIKGSINLLEAVRKTASHSRILMVGSSEEYGDIKSEEIPIDEENLLRPINIYAVTKACQNMLSKIYAKAYGINIIQVRAFNHIGPAQSPNFVVSDFCKQVVEIEKKIHVPIIKTGNLSAVRDFTDVRDVVKAYTKIIQLGTIGETYNVGSGSSKSIKEILMLILSLAKCNIEIKTDSTKMRPIDTKIIEADISKMYKLLNWRPQIELETTIQEMLNYWRKSYEITR